MPPFALPDAPSLEGAPALRDALREVTHAARRPGVYDLPPVEGVPGIAVARWLYRGWLRASLQWRALVHLDPRYLQGEDSAVREQLLLASGGWLYLDAGWRDLDEALIAAQAEGRKIRVLRAGDGPPLHAPRDWGRKLRYLDRYHLVEVDPSLEDLRRSLISHCRSNSAIHLTGPPGVGKRTLAKWAHAALDTRRMSVIRRGVADAPVPGQWEVYEEVGELEADQRYFLRTRLQASARAPSLPAEEELDPMPRPRLPAFAPIRGESPALARVLARAARLARLPMSVLILGEPGVGKELLARAIHEASGRRGEYVTVDLNAVPEDLAESALFGHVKGAFTGAERDRLGAFRRADGGTLLLDELGNLSPRVQAKLLRVLQQGRVQPVGMDRSVPANVRIIAATNANLEGMVSRGEFREDLLQRVNAVTLRLPPLRERPEDIVPLARHFFRDARGVESLPEDWIAPRARAALEQHHWSGNIRELQNVMTQTVVEALDARIEVEHLGPLAPRNKRRTPLLTTSSEAAPGHWESWKIERHLIQRMTAVTLSLPPLRDRAGAVRSAVLGLLEGRPIRLDALRALEVRPWWGNFNELEMDLAALRANVDHPVDLDALKRTLPHLLRPGGSQPIRVMTNLTIQPDGSVKGLQQEFYEGALLVGRIHSLSEMERQAQADANERVRARLMAIHARLGPARPDCLNLDHLPKISRAHFLVTRGERGLFVHALPGVRLPLKAGPLDAQSLTPVQVDQPVSIGRAGELQIRTLRDDRIYLRMFIFAGAVAFEEYGRYAAARIRSRQKIGAETALNSGPPAPLELETTAKATVGVWALSGPERRLLNGILLRYPGGDFKAHIETELRPRAGQPAGSRLASYILRNRPTQYCTRIYEHRLNEELRRELAEAMLQTDAPWDQLDRLPVGIARVIRARMPRT